MEARPVKKTETEHVLIEEYNTAKEEIRVTMDRLIKEQQNLKEELNAANEVFKRPVDTQELNKKLDELDKKIVTDIPKMLEAIETEKLPAVENFLKKKNNARLANVIENKNRIKKLDINKIRENQVKQACKDKKIALRVEERKKINCIFKDELDALQAEIFYKFNDFLEQAIKEGNLEQIKKIENERDVEVANRQREVYEKMDMKLVERMSELELTLKEFEINFRKNHQGNLNTVEKKNAQKNIKDYLKLASKEDIAKYTTIAEDLKSAIADVIKVCARCTKEQARISKVLRSSVRIDIKKQLTLEGNKDFSHENVKDVPPPIKKIKSSSSLLFSLNFNKTNAPNKPDTFNFTNRGPKQ